MKNKIEKKLSLPFVNLIVMLKTLTSQPLTGSYSLSISFKSLLLKLD